ncbi:Transposase [Noviherbaspirillum humi]|uniref:Transposase n=1 Tax=Noviherbaspirillum humi TaxID=1688639 RepID=A0A239L2W4_9BURK|nr:helix-turn-helix domain-containing protein [Noviherbaspirillum humi]SNT24936.1 Transposase [Noviherbaspirillum humi]
MAAALSTDLRWKLIAACERGNVSQREVAEFFGVCLATVEKLWRLYRETGDVVKPNPLPRGRSPSIHANAKDHLRQWIEQQPDATLVELCELLQRQLGIAVSRATVSRTLKDMGMRRKKRPYVPVSKTARRYIRHASATAGR